MEELLTSIAKLYNKNNYDDLQGVVKEKKLLYLYSFYHYYFGDDDYIMDVSEHCNYTKEFGNYAQGFFEQENYDDKIIDVLIPYYVDEGNGEIFDLNHVKYMISQTQALIGQIKNNTFLMNDQGKKLREYWNSENNEKLMIKVITNHIPDYDDKNNFRDIINNLSPLFDEIQFDIVFGDDIIEEISQLTSDKKCVDTGELILDKENNYLTYGDEMSIIANISALSLKSIYKKYGTAGLFSQNLRFYVANKKVDEGLEKSIRERGENFWYYNNGIIIVCDDYKVVDKILILKNFSIVNGGQTTRMIGTIPFNKDFVISCKVIRNKYINDREANAKFVSEIAEASNTQKPINSTDLIANKFEQRLLKEKLATNGIFMQIKRGDSAIANVKENYPEPWQRTKNDELGQLIYATICQRPGTARNSKNTIFSDKKKYEKVFGNVNYDMNMLKDLLYMKTHYKKWSKEVSKNLNSDELKKGLVKNGYFFFSATIMLMSKFAFSPRLSEELKTIGFGSDKGNHIISQITYNHRIFNDSYDALKNRMYELFELVYEKYIRRAFARLRESRPELVYSNFTKVDKNYLFYIANEVYDDFAVGITPRVLNVISPIFYQETELDTINSNELLDDAISSFDKRPVDDEEGPDVISEELKEKLIEFRTHEYKTRNIRAYEVFNNKELDALVVLKPRTLLELDQFSCFKSHPRLKIKQYGRQIIEIIISVCGDRN